MRLPLALALFLAPCMAAQSAADLEALVTTDLGSFRIEFAPDKAPKHVAQFIEFARQGYYSGSGFHRVVANGMIQGGDPLLKDPKAPRNAWGSGGLNLLPAEVSDLKHERGVVSTISIPGKTDSDGAQFFICLAPQPQLDGKYSGFGRVIAGMDVVEKIAQSPAAADGMVEKPVRILKVVIEKKAPRPFADTPAGELRRRVILKTTLGTVTLEMEPDWAPNHVRTFLMLASTGWYDGTSFHRISKDFVVQGGTSNSRKDGVGHSSDRWVQPLKGEFRQDVRHVRGIVSMAHGEDPDSATTSFFLMLGNAPYLDGQYTAFGRIVKGLDVLEAFEKEEVEGESPKRRLEVVEATIE